MRKLNLRQTFYALVARDKKTNELFAYGYDSNENSPYKYFSKTKLTFWAGRTFPKPDCYVYYTKKDALAEAKYVKEYLEPTYPEFDLFIVNLSSPKSPISINFNDIEFINRRLLSSTFSMR